MSGLSITAYAYGLNNPLRYTDGTGCDPTSYWLRNPDECRRNALELAFQACRCKRLGGTFEINFADATVETPTTQGDSNAELIIGGSCSIDLHAPDGGVTCPNATGWSGNSMTDLDHFVGTIVTRCP